MTFDKKLNPNYFCSQVSLLFTLQEMITPKPLHLVCRKKILFTTQSDQKSLWQLTSSSIFHKNWVLLFLLSAAFDEVPKSPYRHVFPITGALCGTSRWSWDQKVNKYSTLYIGERRRASIHSSGGDISETSAPEQIKAAIKLSAVENLRPNYFFPKLAAFISSRRSPAFYIKQHVRETRSLEGAERFYFLTDGAQPRRQQLSQFNHVAARENFVCGMQQQKSSFVGFYIRMQSATRTHERNTSAGVWITYGTGGECWRRFCWYSFLWRVFLLPDNLRVGKVIFCIAWNG